MSSNLVVMQPNLAATLLLDVLMDWDHMDPAHLDHLRELAVDAQIETFFNQIGWDAEKYLAMGVKVSPNGALESWEMLMLEHLAPALLEGSFTIWHDESGVGAVVIDQGRVVRLAEVEPAEVE